MRNDSCFRSPKKVLNFCIFINNPSFPILHKFVVTVSVFILILMLPSNCKCSSSGTGKSEMLTNHANHRNNTISETTVKSKTIIVSLNRVQQPQPRNTRNKYGTKRANTNETKKLITSRATTERPKVGQVEKRTLEKPVPTTPKILQPSTADPESNALVFDEAEADPDEANTESSFDNLSLSSSEEEEDNTSSVLLPTLISTTEEIDEFALSEENEVSEEDNPHSKTASYEETENSPEEDGEVYEESNVSSEAPSPSPFLAKTGVPKISHNFAQPTQTTRRAFIAFASTARSVPDDFSFLKKTVKSPRPRPTTRRPPKKVIKPGTYKTPRPATPPPVFHNPHHPHGVVLFDRRRKRPKPIRRTTTTTTTSTTTTTATPELQEDYYEYEWTSSAENFGDKNGTNSGGKRPKIPLSKLAMAMIASSEIFQNGTNELPIEYQKNPVNLLNILQAYTKQLQLQIANNGSVEPVELKPTKVQISNSPFMVHLNSLNFASKIGISIYYSLIAIIPLVYLAFGGLGRLAVFNTFSGRRFGKKKRRKRSDYYYYNGDLFKDRLFPVDKNQKIVKRIALSRDDDDEYAWIMGRLSEIILEFSFSSSDEMDEDEN